MALPHEVELQQQQAAAGLQISPLSRLTPAPPPPVVVDRVLYLQQQRQQQEQARREAEQQANALRAIAALRARADLLRRAALVRQIAEPVTTLGLTPQPDRGGGGLLGRVTGAVRRGAGLTGEALADAGRATLGAVRRGADVPLPMPLGVGVGGTGTAGTVNVTPRQQVEIARTDIPYVEPVREAAAWAGRRAGEGAAGITAGPFAPALDRLGVIDRAGDVGAVTGEAVIPREMWELAAELVPGIGVAPDIARAARAGAPDALLALRRAMASPRGQEIMATARRAALGGERGALQPERFMISESGELLAIRPTRPARPRSPLDRMTPVQGIDVERAAPRGDLPGGGRDEIGLKLDMDAERDIRTFIAKAEETGAPDEVVRSVAQAYADGQTFMATARRYADAPATIKIAAKTRAMFEGNVPDGVINAIARAHLVGENAIRLWIDQQLRQFRGLGARIERLRPQVRYVGPARMAELAQRHFAHAFITHPEWWEHGDDLIRADLAKLQEFQTGLYRVIQSIDRNAAPLLDAPYLRTVWDIPENEIMSAVVMPVGRASVTKRRAFPDPFEAMLDRRWPFQLKDVPVDELVESAAHLAGRQIGIQLERKMVLDRFGTTSQIPGLRQFRNPNYAGWYASPEVVNFIDQLHEPAGSVTRAIGAVTNPFRNTVFGIADIGVFGMHILQLIATRGPVAMAGAINRSLELLGAGVDVYRYADADVPRAIQRELDGVPQGRAGRVADEGAKTLLSLIPGAGRRIDAAVHMLQDFQFSAVLAPLRNMAFEGNLLVSKALGRDIMNPAVRRAAAENANAFSGASLGALRMSRRQAEATYLGTVGITRTMAAQLAQVAKLNTPEAWTTLASFAAMVYGLGSFLNMQFGSGTPVPFDPRRVDWAQAHVGGRWETIQGRRTYVGGYKIRLVPQASLVRALGKSVLAIQEGDLPAFTRAWNQFAFTRLTPAAQAALGLGAGIGFSDEGFFRMGTLDTRERLTGAAPIPIGVQQAGGEEAMRTPEGLALTALGVPAYPGDTKDEAAEAIRKERAEAVRKQLEKEDFPDLRRAFRDYPAFRAAWARAFGVDPSTVPEEYDEFREMMVKIAVDAGMPESVARHRFDTAGFTQQVRQRLADAQLAFWRRHRDLLREAIETGVENTSEEKERILRGQ